MTILGSAGRSAVARRAPRWEYPLILTGSVIVRVPEGVIACGPLPAMSKTISSVPGRLLATAIAVSSVPETSTGSLSTDRLLLVLVTVSVAPWACSAAPASAPAPSTAATELLAALIHRRGMTAPLTCGNWA
jgi:hypothetical protein